jgi:hypothetical protein
MLGSIKRSINFDDFNLADNLMEMDYNDIFDKI